MRLEFQIDGEAADGIGQCPESSTIGRSQQRRVGQLEYSGRMKVGNQHIGFITITIGRQHGDSSLVIAFDMCHLLFCNHLATIAFNGSLQGNSDEVAAAHHTIGTLVIEVGNEGMSGKRRLIFLGRVER